MGEFKFYKNGNKGEFLKIESDRLSEMVTFIKKNKIKNIALNQYWGYKIKDIKFIHDIASIVERVEIITDDIHLEGINSLYALRSLSLNDKYKYPVDFSLFKNLEYCSIGQWDDVYISLKTCKMLKGLSIGEFEINQRNKDVLLKLNNLKELTLIHSKIGNLDFLSSLTNLRELEIYYMISLRDIKGLGYCNDTLKKLIIDRCKGIKMEQYDTIGGLKELEFLNLTDSKPIGNLNFITQLKKLKHFSFFGTDIIDGNLDPCNGISFVGFENKKKYNHTFEEFNPNWTSGLDEVK